IAAHPRDQLLRQKIRERPGAGQVAFARRLAIDHYGHHRRDLLLGDQVVENRGQRDDKRNNLAVEEDQQSARLTFRVIPRRSVDSDYALFFQNLALDLMPLALALRRFRQSFYPGLWRGGGQFDYG